MKIKGIVACLTLLMGGVCAVNAESEPQSQYAPLTDEVLPELSATGSHRVGVKTLTIDTGMQPLDLSGKMKNRTLTLEVWYPGVGGDESAVYENQTRSGKAFAIRGRAHRDAGIANSDTPFPLVVLSHGYTGYRTIMYYLGEHLASHGYIVAGIDHTGSTNADIDMANAPFAGFPNTLLNRSRDQQHTLEVLVSNSEFKKVIDDNAAGLIGYSMGGYGAVNTVGGCFAFDAPAVTRLTGISDSDAVAAIRAQLNTCAGGKKETHDTDPRWKAMIAMAPWGGQFPVFSADAMKKIDVPVLYVGGEHDDISGYNGIRWLYEHTQTTPAYLLTVHNARHNIAAHPAPKEALGSELDLGHYYEPAWRTQSLNEINKHFALAMMNCYVKDISEDCKYLAVRGSSAQAPSEGKTPPPWTGFDNRFALGLTMEANSQASDN